MKKLTIEAMQLVARKRDGKCLSRVYVDSKTHLLWRCKHDHKWKASPGSILRGSWCPKCVGQGKTILEMRKVARSRQGFCLSKKYAGMFVKLRWRCKMGHEFETTPNHVVNHATWCPRCSLKANCLTPTERRAALSEMKKLARLKGGWCLSKEYKNSLSHLKWRCKNGHEWRATPGHIKNSGTWCATCAAGVSERICRAVLERIFRTPFPKKKPVWLLSERGTRMELDGFSEKSKIAFEYQGIQHFVSNAHFHSERSTLSRRQSDDERKAALCEARGITLLQVPHTVPHAEFEDYIYAALGSLSEDGKVMTFRLNRSKIDLATLNAYSPTHLSEMQKLAIKRGGNCLSKAYVNNETRLQWRCERGHVWEAAPEVIKMGHWCPDCAGNRRLTLEHMKQLAQRRGGECLAKEYFGNKTKITWKCANGHTWDAKPDNIQTGKWCPHCSKSPPKTIAYVQAFAKTRGGVCLSTRYVNAHSKLWFRCAQGHEWQARWNNLQQGQWCPECGRKKASSKRRQENWLDEGCGSRTRRSVSFK